ncbi:YARHG domain-containing protein [Vitiosangium sp. GDMCC 1.1324]|uniref:YARHG domain-containing protein n=1 Tax=Vitiosangium sp. (strain GDMCC 1.1324) TaxID=2138576 RepID=UPI00130DA1CD|nr:YARHG domain-containing protein [Vitiosangium sp. GDMCC 1.1324]
MRALVLTTLVVSASALAAPPAEYVPAPAKEIAGYSETVFPCKVSPSVVCNGEPHLESKSLRELSLLRNTIYARYGWAGFRKPWLRQHFQSQPWYKPDPKFSYKRLSQVDRRNVELIAQVEASLSYADLEQRKETLLARTGRSNLAELGAEDRIELGLISRAMGDFAVDEGQRDQVASSLESVLAVKELRMLSLRDLRLLRNTIYARRGRPFKSELLQEHFKRMPWYTPDPAYTDKRLTKTDKRNIDLIVQVENEFGGALHDKDFMVENPSKEGIEEPVPIGMQA